MRNKKNLIKLFAALLILALVTEPTQAYAAFWGRGHNDYRHYPQHGRYSLWLPAAVTALAIAGLTYYYCEGVYYRRAPYGYVVVPPPPSAVVQVIPPTYQQIVINGVTYYTADGIYYQYTPQGYMVVQQPYAVSTPPSVIQPPVNASNVFTVNVPTNRGGYVPVTIRRAGSGYIGPQGEFYSEFPNVEQLRAMYGNR